MGGEHTDEPEQMKSRWRDERDEASDKVERLKHHGGRSVRPRFLHGVAQPSIGQPAEAVLGKRRPGDVTTEPFEPWPVATVKSNFGMHVKPKDPAHRLHLAARLDCRQLHKAQVGLPRSPTHQVGTSYRCSVTGGQDWLVDAERFVIVLYPVVNERARE